MSDQFDRTAQHIFATKEFSGFDADDLAGYLRNANHDGQNAMRERAARVAHRGAPGDGAECFDALSQKIRDLEPQ